MKIAFLLSVGVSLMQGQGTADQDLASPLTANAAIVQNSVGVSKSHPDVDTVVSSSTAEPQGGVSNGDPSHRNKRVAPFIDNE